MTAPVRPEIDLSHVPLVHKLRNNHAGAAMALMDLLRVGRRIGEPMDADALWCLGALEKLNIYGSDLYAFWCFCDESARQMIRVLRACNEGCYGLGYDDVRQAITSGSHGTLAIGGRELVSEVSGL